MTSPFGLLVTSNVKNLQKEFLNKSSANPPPENATDENKTLEVGVAKVSDDEECNADFCEQTHKANHTVDKFKEEDGSF